MSAETNKILGLDIGARQIGVSILRGEELVFYAVKTFKSRNQSESLQKLEAILEKLIADYEIEFVAVEKLVFIQQHRSFVKIVYQNAKNFLGRQRVTLFEYNPKTIKQTLCKAEKPTKRNAALMLAQHYAELVRYFNMPRLWQKRYYAQLFDAIAAGVVCAKELKEKKQSLINAINQRR